MACLREQAEQQAHDSLGHQANTMTPWSAQERACKALRHELASLVAAAAHTGLISSQEGVSHAIDHMQFAQYLGEYCTKAAEGASELWPCLLAERFLDLDMPREQGFGILAIRMAASSNRLQACCRQVV